jgi:hypothetical protein|tara:strand:- start:1370 stop:2356 length:987 start_codon:yes stop_codon:yes gene_type:complete
MAETKLTRDHHLWTRDTVKNVSGDMTIDVAGDINLEAAGADIILRGTDEAGLVFSEGSDDWSIVNGNDNQDIIFKVVDNASVNEIMRLNGDISSLDIYSGRALTFGAVGQFIRGDGTDLDITSGNDLDFKIARDFKVDAEGDIVLNANGGDITLKDDTSTFVPTQVYHAATKEYVDSVMYDHRVCNYNNNTTSLVYVPLAGYVLESAFTAGGNEYRAMVMPYDGTLERIIWRSEIEQTSGTFTIGMFISSDGTEVPATINFRTRVLSFTLAANTTYVHDPGVTQGYDSGAGNETNAFSKGQIVAVAIGATVAPYDTNCTLVFKYDPTT